MELYGIQVEFNGMPWNSMECHGRYIISMAFQWNYVASRWNAMECHGRYIISMEFQLNYMASRWNAMECHGTPWDTED